jgi:phosphoribosylglycinamide formyltransferase 1
VLCGYKPQSTLSGLKIYYSNRYCLRKTYNSNTINRMSELHKPKIAILASGSGSTAEAVIRATQDGRLDAEVQLLISNNPGAGVFDRAQRLDPDIETFCVNKDLFPFRKREKRARGQSLAESERICRLLSERSIGHVAALGYTIVITGDTLREYGWREEYAEHGDSGKYMARMSNSHPGILPETADTVGLKSSERVLDLGLPETAHIFHIVAKEIDAGPVLASTPVSVESDDTAETLFGKVQLVEKAVLPVAIDRFLKEQAVYLGNS